jgi:hypothetical protein
MTIPNEHQVRVLDALKEHDTSFLMKYIEINDRQDVIEFAVQEALSIEQTVDDRSGDGILMSLVHSQVTPVEVVTEAYRQGRASA